MKKNRNQGINAESTLIQNRRLILRLIKDSGVVSRRDLAAKTGLQHATITIAINDFLESGLIEETGFIEGHSGRKVKGFSFAGGKFCTIAIRLTISYISIGIYDGNAKNIFVKKVFMDTLKNIEKTCDFIADEINALKPLTKDLTVLGVGVAVEGPFILHDGFYMMPYPKSPDGYYDLGKELHNKLKYPIIINRENNFCVYYFWKKIFKERNIGIIVNILISYAVECGVMINGEIVNGQLGSTGLLGKTGIGYDQDGNIITLDDKISSSALLKRAQELMGEYPTSTLQNNKDNLNIRDIIAGYYVKDPLSVCIYNEAAIFLGRAIANLINLLNPDTIIIGDEMPSSDEWLEIVKSEIQPFVSKEIFNKLSLINYSTNRQTKLSGSLLGAANYLVDAYIMTADL